MAPWLNEDGTSRVAAEATAAAAMHISVTIQGETPAPEEIEGQRAEVVMASGAR